MLPNLLQKQKIVTSDVWRERRDASASLAESFTRIVQRKNLPWEKDSIARAPYDPAHIPDCNVQATVGHHFIFSEPIPRTNSESGERTRVPPSNQEVIMVANCTVPHRLDIRGTHHVYGDRVSIYDQQDYVEPPQSHMASAAVRPAEASTPRNARSECTRSQWLMMILLLLFLQKQSLAFAVYLFGIGTLLTGLGSKKNTCDNVLTTTSKAPW
jgi:hypothetical protein